jgi:hypothetical protein
LADSRDPFDRLRAVCLRKGVKLGKAFDKVPDEVPDKGQQRLTR